MQEAYDHGLSEKAFRIYQALFPVNRAVTALYGIPGLKFACDINGYKGGHVRSPLMPCPDAGRAHIKKVLNDSKYQIQTIH